jgi:multidrug efflux pump subunit AcrA (membrane-fusion protein)
VTFDVKVEVEGRRKSLLKPEMTTNVTFIVDERKDVVLVPASAVVRRAVRVEAPEGASAPADGTQRQRMDYSRRESFVTVLRADGTEDDRKVVPGITDGNNMEIVSGLNEGETVVLLQAADSVWAGQATRPGRR